MTTLIYGVKCVSAQSEFALSELAEHVKEECPELALFLIVSRYVDDLLDSKSGLEDCLRLTKVADEVFSRVGLVCKGWTYSTLPPSPKVSKDGLSVGDSVCNCLQICLMDPLIQLEPQINRECGP